MYHSLCHGQSCELPQGYLLQREQADVACFVTADHFVRHRRKFLCAIIRVVVSASRRQLTIHQGSFLHPHKEVGVPQPSDGIVDCCYGAERDLGIHCIDHAFDKPEQQDVGHRFIEQSNAYCDSIGFFTCCQTRISKMEVRNPT
jgi:hypothetical protein